MIMQCACRRRCAAAAGEQRYDHSLRADHLASMPQCSFSLPSGSGRGLRTASVLAFVVMMCDQLFSFWSPSPGICASASARYHTQSTSGAMPSRNYHPNWATGIL